jgi:hypothetical protein
MNIAMGKKLLWILVTSKLLWWKQVIWKKYLWGPRIRCMEHPPRVFKGSSIFNLILSTLLVINIHINWIPGNGKLIKFGKFPSWNKVTSLIVHI